jgi:two-component system cell cycle sensor histidine kinase/response regulator CckA
MDMKEPTANRSEAGNSAGALIYVVDDEPMVLELATMILEPLGYAIEAFRDAESALLAFTSAPSRPGLVITDYAMHKMTGLDLMKACRQERPGQKFLLVSGTVDETVYRGAEQKPDSFLAKPYQAKQLSDRVKALLE